MLACSDSTFGKHVLDGINEMYECELGSHACSHNPAHESPMLATNTPKHGGGFEISFTEYLKEISLISFPSHRRRDRKSPNHTTWAVSTSSLEWPFTLVGYAVLATLAGAPVTEDATNAAGRGGHDFEVNRLARKATVLANTPLKLHAHHLLWSHTQMLDGLHQTERYKEDSWSSS